MKRALALLALVAACRQPAPETIAATRATPHVDGQIVALAELGDTIYYVTPEQIVLERAGSVLATIPPPKASWTDAVAIPALDGEGTWIAARTSDDHLWRLRPGAGGVEPLEDRLGLPKGARAVGGDGATTAFVVADGVAILRDRMHVARYPLDPPPQRIAVARDRLALVDPTRVALWDLARATRVDFPIANARMAGFVDGALVVATADAVFVERRGGLHREAAPAPIRDAAIAGARVWVATDNGLLALDRDRFAPTTVLGAASHVFGLANGDVVLAPERGPAIRLAVAADADPSWTRVVAPIFQKVCAKCHLPGGSADADLSTAAAWRAGHSEIVRRVVETRTMPPEGTDLADADRRALAEWLRLRP